MISFVDRWIIGDFICCLIFQTVFCTILSRIVLEIVWWQFSWNSFLGMFSKSIIEINDHTCDYE